MKLSYSLFTGYVMLTGCTSVSPAPETTAMNLPLIEVDEVCGEDPICVSSRRLVAKACLVDATGQALRYASEQELSDARRSGIELAKCVPSGNSPLNKPQP